MCRRLLWHYRLRGGLLAIPAASELREPEKQKGAFPETTTFERYAVKTSEKVNVRNRTGLDPLALCTLGAQEVTTNGTCIDSHMLSTTVASPCQTLRRATSGRPRVQIAQPIN